MLKTMYEQYTGYTGFFMRNKELVSTAGGDGGGRKQDAVWGRYLDVNPIIQ